MAAPGDLSPSQAGRIENLQIIVKQETPFLPKVAFTLITLASLGGALLTGSGMGLRGAALGWRWLSLWAMALAGGFLVWRLVYLRRREAGLDGPLIDRMTSASLHRAEHIGRLLAPVAALAVLGPLTTGYLGFEPPMRWVLAGATIALALLLGAGVSRPWAAYGASAACLVLVLGWAYADAGLGLDGALRALHLAAFTLWLGGALWNITVAMPTGRKFPVIDAVLAGARQLDRFRWVVRFALPTIIITGLWMASDFLGASTHWWWTYPGVLIPLKIAAILALIVVFITCPLFRHCSPVQGVCNVEDLHLDDGGVTGAGGVAGTGLPGAGGVSAPSDSDRPAARPQR